MIEYGTVVFPARPGSKTIIDAGLYRDEPRRRVTAAASCRPPASRSAASSSPAWRSSVAASR